MSMRRWKQNIFLLQSGVKPGRRDESVRYWEAMWSHAGWRRELCPVQTQTGRLPVLLSSFFSSLFAASSTPAVNIQPDVAGGWDWHTKPGKGQQVIFCTQVTSSKCMVLHPRWGGYLEYYSPLCSWLFLMIYSLAALFPMHLMTWYILYKSCIIFL